MINRRKLFQLAAASGAASVLPGAGEATEIGGALCGPDKWHARPSMQNGYYLATMEVNSRADSALIYARFTVKSSTPVEIGDEIEIRSELIPEAGRKAKCVSCIYVVDEAIPPQINFSIIE